MEPLPPWETRKTLDRGMGGGGRAGSRPTRSSDGRILQLFAITDYFI